MEVIMAIAIGVLGGSGVWLVLRPRSFQVLIGLALLSYAVNLFIFAMGSLFIGREPIVRPGLAANLHYTDPLPQALVLTAIVIGFATSALFLVVLLASRGCRAPTTSTARSPTPTRRSGDEHAFVASLMPHLIAAPILLPMATAALMLLLGDAPAAEGLVSVLSCALGLAASVGLLLWVQHGDGRTRWACTCPATGPALRHRAVVDRLSAMMLLLTSVLGLAAVLYSVARWDRAGVHFHPLFQLQLMGLAGAFLTADLFNLFVFFEILLAASYGLLLHGSGGRACAGLHYIAINLMASSLFLIGVAMLYGVTGTLNLADMAIIVPAIADTDRGLLHAGAAVLAVGFLVKAAAWPLNFWLPSTYASASTPVAALFAILTKLGAYAVLRVWTVLFGPDAGVSPVRRPGAGGHRPGHAGAGRHRHAGHPAPGAHGGVLRHRVLGHAAGGAGLRAAGGDGRRAVLHPGLDAGGVRLLPAVRADRPRARHGGAAGRPERRADRQRLRLPRQPGAHARRQPGRGRAGADRPAHSGGHGLPGPGLHRLRADAGGAAADGRLRRQGGDAVGAAQPGRLRPERAGVAGGLAAAGPAAGQRPAAIIALSRAGSRTSGRPPAGRCRACA
jgi:multisubunit Na+/H+ antiporter MnhC subunit